MELSNLFVVFLSVFSVFLVPVAAETVDPFDIDLTPPIIRDTEFRSRDNTGTEFVVGFLQNEYEDESKDLKLFFSTSEDIANVEVYMPLFDPSYFQFFPIKRNESFTVTLPKELRGRDVEKSNKAVWILSDVPISVYALNSETGSADGYMVLPKASLGQEYYAMTYSGDPALLVAATEDDTTIKIKLPDYNRKADNQFMYQGQFYKNGDTFNITLDKNETFHLVAKMKSADLTGAHIYADKPFAVFSGNTKVNVPQNEKSNSRDHLCEMMTPCSSWGKRFVTISTPERKRDDLFRIMAWHDNTRVSIQDLEMIVNLRAGEFKEMTLDKETQVFIMADNPVMVAMFSMSVRSNRNDEDVGDASMVLLPPVSQYNKDYYFSTVVSDSSSDTDFKHFLTVVIQKDKLDRLRLDGFPQDSWLTDKASIEDWDIIFGSDNMVMVYKEVLAGAHSLTHPDPDVYYMAMVSGKAPFTAYSYMAGMRLDTITKRCVRSNSMYGDGIDNDCDSLIDEEMENGIDDDGDGLIDEDIDTPKNEVLKRRGPYGPDSKGKMFIFGLPQLKTSEVIAELILYTDSNNPVEVSVTLPLHDLSFNKTITLFKGDPQIIILPRNLAASEVGKERKGIFVIASDEISIRVQGREPEDMDSFLCLPTDVLGQEYYPATVPGVAQMMVVGTSNDTTVILDFSNAKDNFFYNGVSYGKLRTEKLVVNLDKFETLHLTSQVKSTFMGIRVTSNKPIAFISGNLNADYGPELFRGRLDRYTEMIPPVNTWGRLFVTIHTDYEDENKETYYLIVASETNITMTVDQELVIEFGEDMYKIEKFAPGKIFEFSAPVLVLLFTDADPVPLVDPNNTPSGAMVMLQSYSQWAPDYTWPVMVSDVSVKVHINVIIDMEALDSLVLDDKENISWTYVKDLDNGFVLLSMDGLTYGIHSLYSKDPTTPFLMTLTVRGSKFSYDSTLCMRLSPINLPNGCSRSYDVLPGDIMDNDCDGLIDEELPNGEDDDNDGLIDEDLALPPSKLLKCEVSGDPHLKDYTNDRANLPIPCLYRVTRLQIVNVVNKFGMKFYPYIEVDVYASNGKTPLKGRYFVSDVEVNILFYTLISGSRVRGPSATFYTSADRIANASSMDSEEIWRRLPASEDLQDRIHLDYEPLMRSARLHIRGTHVDLKFVFADMTMGIYQKPKPGCYIKTGSREVRIDEDLATYPVSVCSTPYDTLSPWEHAQQDGVLKSAQSGIYGILEQKVLQIFGDERDRCSKVQFDYSLCHGKKTEALDTCSPFLNNHRLVSCYHDDHSDSAFKAFADCIDYVCKGDSDTCRNVESSLRRCDHVKDLPDFQCSP